MTATNDDLNSIVITLEPAPLQARSFSSLLFLSDEAGGTSLGGDRVRSYTTNAAAQADATLSAACKAALQVMFAQPRHPAAIKVGRVDTAGGESYADALALCITADPDFFGICMDDRTDAQISLVTAAVEALDDKRFAVFQSDEAEWLTSGLPAGLAALSSKEWSAVTYHDEVNQAQAEAWLSYALGWEPDEKSNTWLLSLASVAALTTGLTETERGHARANFCNLALPYGSATHFLANGVNCNGRPCDQLLTTAWFIDRVKTGLAEARLKASARGDKITIDATGQAIAFAVVNEWLQRGAGLESPHFLPGQIRASLPTITAADISNRQIRVEVEATFATDALGFDVDGNFSTTLIFTEE